jgi:hypothetical protein
VALFLAEGEGSLDQVISCYLFEDFMLILDGLELYLAMTRVDLDHLQGIHISCFYSAGEIDLPEGTLSQKP